ncbi:helix-turn-helix domain-containing protein [Klebsiella quasipneumoniae]|uniref:helix-turn-helix domain-containing protein n=1 Tax=Klebsiella quasipneumoniae TaxID=1463165 RepID=UPI002ABC7139|nr:helix-turn-helix transcriptional regulator [Klebsiella quasipneumoniae]MDZ0185195.1 helix-turn-helix transcriptional regulator [Klebsiella quasipneumoniae]
MNIYILTENNYLFYGISFLLKKKVKVKRVVTLQGNFSSADIILLDIDSLKDSASLINECINNNNVKLFITNKLSQEIVTVNGVFIVNLIKALNALNKIIDDDFVNRVTCKYKNSLTRNESIIIRHLLDGKDFEDISNLMNIKGKTVYSHLNNIQNKMDCKGVHFIFYFRFALQYSIRVGRFNI